MKYVIPITTVLGITGLVLWRKYGKTEQVRNVVDPLKLKLPVFGDLFAKLALARFARNLGTLLSSGYRSCSHSRSCPTPPARS